MTPDGAFGSSADGGQGFDRVIDASGCLVVPGLIDAHAHVFNDVMAVSAPVDETCVGRGVVAVVDAGSAGASTFQAFRRVIEHARTRVLCYLNVSTIGVIDGKIDEAADPSSLRVEDALAMVANHPSEILGFKVRLGVRAKSGSDPVVLETALRMADLAELPLMVHIGGNSPDLQWVVRRVRPGDVITHCYTPLGRGILDGHGTLDAVLESQQRGVLFDVGHGRGHFSFAIAREAFARGFMPDLISTDLTVDAWRSGLVADLPTTMSKLVAIGMPIEEVVRGATSSPARLLGIHREGYGGLETGRPAHVTILKWSDPCELKDVAGEQLRAPRLEPQAVIANGVVQPVVKWSPKWSPRTRGAGRAVKPGEV